MIPTYLPAILVPIVGLFLPFVTMAFFFILLERETK